MYYKQTEILQVDASNPEPDHIERAAALLRRGETVVFPTETVYGLGADALQTSAVERIFVAKGRPFSDPLIIHIADKSDLEEMVAHIPPEAQRLADAFWPGPLTLILPAGPRIPQMITSGLPTVAIRMPRHPIALALIRATGSPIAAPSANRFMHISPTTAQHAFSDLQGRIPLILDGGTCEIGLESTILDLSSEVPVILRPGGISLETLRTLLPEVQPPLARKPVSEEVAQKSPGQMLIHYAPSVPTFLFDGTVEEMRVAMQQEVQRHQERGEQVGVLIADEDVPSFQESGAFMYTLGDSATPEQIAGRLFAGLHTLEEAGVEIILCRNFADQGIGLAIRDRLLKAAGGKIYKRHERSW